jgi:hypothetical protein
MIYFQKRLVQFVFYSGFIGMVIGSCVQGACYQPMLPPIIVPQFIPDGALYYPAGLPVPVVIVYSSQDAFLNQSIIYPQWVTPPCSNFSSQGASPSSSVASSLFSTPPSNPSKSQNDYTYIKNGLDILYSNISPEQRTIIFNNLYNSLFFGPLKKKARTIFWNCYVLRLLQSICFTEIQLADNRVIEYMNRHQSIFFSFFHRLYPDVKMLGYCCLAWYQGRGANVYAKGNLILALKMFQKCTCVEEYKEKYKKSYRDYLRNQLKKVVLCFIQSFIRDRKSLSREHFLDWLLAGAPEAKDIDLRILVSEFLEEYPYSGEAGTAW